MRWFNKLEHVDLVAMEGDTVTFQSNSSLRPGHLDVDVGVSGLRHLQARIRVDQEVAPYPALSHRVGELGYQSAKHLYQGQIESPAEMVPHLQKLLPPCPDRARRVDSRCRVVSPDLPEFQGVATDLSTTGLGLLVRGPVSPGKRLRLTLEFRGRALPVVAKVVWCKKLDSPRTYQVGANFEGMLETNRRWLAHVVEETQLEQARHDQGLFTERRNRYVP